MSEYRISQEINLFEIADKYAKRLQEQVDETTLDKSADALAKFGYVKVVRCRDCKFYKHNSFHRCDLRMQAVEVEPDGFCAWAKRRES